MRSVAISSMVLLLVAALLSGPCAACFGGSQSCCTPCDHCKKPAKCAAAQVNLSHLQKVHSGVSFSLEESGATLSWLLAPLVSRDAFTATTSYSLPDLYLRNSVLNI